MTVHICRDVLLGGTLGGQTSSYDSFWTVGIFLQGVLGFTVASSAGAAALIPPPYADTTVPYFSATQTGPNSWTFAQVSSSILNRTTGSCFINLGTGKEMYVQFSPDVMNLSAAAYPIGYPDISASFPAGAGTNFWDRKWLCLKSNEYPLANSGIFEVVSQSYSDNALIIEYRAGTGSFPPVQTGSFATASIWLPPPGSDNGFPGRTAATTGPITTLVNNGAGSTGYSTSGSTATFPRVVLTSPHSSSWQVRLCIESVNDMWNANDPTFTAIPGFGAIAGDFMIGKYLTTSSLHLHINNWWNEPGSSLYFPNFTNRAGTRPGLDRWWNTFGGGLPQIWNSEVWRISGRLYMWGDDQTGSCLVFHRPQRGPYENCFMMFGIPEDEPDPLPGTHPIHRLFTMGNTYFNAIKDIDWRNGEYNSYGIGGAAYSLDKRQGPISCVMAFLASVAFTASSFGSTDRPLNFDLRMHSSSFAGGAREVIPVELIAGGWDNQYINGQPPVYPLEIRRLGHVPIARMGTNVAMSNWVTADDDRTWFHIKNGMYLPWGGIIPLP